MEEKVCNCGLKESEYNVRHPFVERLPMKPVPEVGKTYNCFDDGKITPGRMYTVKVVQVTPFDEAYFLRKSLWDKHVVDYDWLFAKETDYFVVADNGDDELEVFARTKDGGWFSMCSWLEGGRLDVDGKLTESIN